MLIRIVMKKRVNSGTDSEETSLSRRTWLKTLGVGASLLTIGSGTATATSHGYGAGGYGEGEYGDPSTALTVTTDAVSDVGETTATLDGSLTDLGGASSADVHFEYREGTVTTWRSTAVQTLSSTGSFSASVSDLSDGTDYEFRAVASAADGSSDVGATSGFTTIEDSVVVATDGSTDVAETTATLTGSVTDLGNATSADVSFEYRGVGLSSWTTSAVQTLTSTGGFSASVSGLDDGTEYEFRATAEASDGDTATGGSVTFTTVTAESDPAIDSFSVSEAGSPNPHTEISADWTVSDADGDLSAVTVSVSDPTGATVRSNTTSVSGGSASGSESFRIKHSDSDTYDVTLQVEDGAGNAASDTRSVSA